MDSACKVDPGVVRGGGGGRVQINTITLLWKGPPVTQMGDREHNFYHELTCNLLQNLGI